MIMLICAMFGSKTEKMAKINELLSKFYADDYYDIDEDAIDSTTSYVLIRPSGIPSNGEIISFLKKIVSPGTITREMLDILENYNEIVITMDMVDKRAGT